MAIFRDAPSPQAPDPSEVLESVRAGSCYGALRGIFNMIFILNLLICAVAAAGGVMQVVHSFDIYYKGPMSNPAAGIAIVAGAIFLGFLGYAARQAAFVLIDIADLLIANRADVSLASRTGTDNA